MNKQTILAFVLIFAGIFFFQSDLYFNKILGQKSPTQTAQEQQEKKAKQKITQETDTTKQEKQPAKTDSLTFPEKKEQIIKAPQVTPKSVTAQSGLASSQIPVTIETPLYICKISRTGARIVSFKMKDYHPYGDKNVKISAELIPENSEGACNLVFKNRNYDSLPFICIQKETLDSMSVNKSDSLTLTFLNPGENGKNIEKEFLFRGSDWRIGFTLRKQNTGNEKIKLGWLSGVCPIDWNPKAKSSSQSTVYGYKGFLRWGEVIEQADDFKQGTREYSGLIQWAGIKEGYFGIAMILNEAQDASIAFKEETFEKQVSKMSFEIEQNFEGKELKYEIFAGPLKYSLLKSYGANLDRMIFQGYSWFFKADVWFPPLCGFILLVLNAFYRPFPDYGISILLLTIVSRIIMIPLTLKSQKSMSAMKDLQPKMTEIRTRYKADSAKMNAELMKLYKKHGISPMGAGCLPMLLQMPIFIALFVALRQAVELRGATTFIPWVKDLSQPDIIYTLPFTLPFYGNGICVLPILMAIFTYFQNKMTLKDPNQKMMVYFMPIFLLFLFNSFPAGLNFYWTLSTAFGILQQLWIERRKAGKALPAKA